MVSAPEIEVGYPADARFVIRRSDVGEVEVGRDNNNVRSELEVVVGVEAMSGNTFSKAARLWTLERASES
jgi:hypothetical protein